MVGRAGATNVAVVSIPAWLSAFVDDAAIFPPGNLPLDRALVEHREHRASEYADLVGGFVVSDVKLPDLIRLLDGASPDQAPLGVNLVVTGGAGAVEPAVRWATRAPGVRLVALECALRDEDDLARNAQRFAAALDPLEADLEDVRVFVELPRIIGEPSHGWLGAADELAMRELSVKLRTGGVTADAFPTPAELAACIDAALDRELAFKCTAGLHHAVRHRDDHDGFEHHGFLNVLLATRLLLDGDRDAGWVALNQVDPAATVAGLQDFSPEELGSTRRWFTSFGSCSVLEPHDDLVELGLVDVAGASS
jgi:hypothetical protein